MPKIGGKRKKNRTHKDITEDETREEDAIPKSLIFKRGKVTNLIKHVVSDMREIMYPYTTINLKENDKTKIKDYINTCKVYGLSHLQIFTSTEKHNYVRFIKNPEGPTITFKMISYCTRKDVLQSQQKKKNFARNFKPPVLIMTGFNKEITKPESIRNPPSSNHYKVVSQMIQSMFPPLNLQKAKIHNLQRIVLFQYDNEKDVISMRHFHVSLVPVSSNKTMQKVLRASKTPNLRDYKDFSDFINKKKKIGGENSGNVSESEAEDGPDSKIELDQKSFKKQFTTKLHEIGPRLKLRLYKIEEGMLRGNVIYNRMVIKKGEEIEAQRKKILEQRAEKEKRKLEQEKNVKKKKAAEKLKEKEKEKKQQQKQQSKEEQEEGEGGYDEPDEEEINNEDGYFNKKVKTDNNNQENGNDNNGDEEEDAEYRGVDEDMQDFDIDDLSDEESEQFIIDLEKQLKKLQQENVKIQNNQGEDDYDDEEEDDNDDEEDDNEEAEDDDDEDDEELNNVD